MNTEKKKICSRCVLPEIKPGIVFDEKGICSLCRDYDKTGEKNDTRPLLESDFVQLLNKHSARKKGRYDCLVMCSGGKDSTSSLYYMKRRYRLNPLAFTFDHGFETPEALENINRAVEVLGVDYLFFKTDYMKKMFREIVNTDSRAVICHPCSIWYMDLTFDIACRYGIPVIIAGWTKGQSTRQPLMSKCGCSVHQQEFMEMGKATADFLREYTSAESEYKNFPLSMEEVLARAKKKHKAIVLSPHWFLGKSEEEYVQIIQKELGWKYPGLSYPTKSTNCLMNFISVENSMRHFGYTHYHVEMSKMIRAGAISRAEALTRLKKNYDDNLLEDILKRVNTGGG